MQRDCLLGVEQVYRVEVAEAGGAAATHHHHLGGQGPLGDIVAVLGSELQFEPRRVRHAGAHAHGVEQAVLGGPGELGGLAHRAGGIRVDRHGRAPPRSLSEDATGGPPGGLTAAGRAVGVTG